MGLLELAPRKAELERLGFTIVRDLADEVVGARVAFHWDLSFRLLTVCRVRKVGHLDEDGLDKEQDGIEAIAKQTDYTALPRGFQFGWQLLDIWLADSVSDGAKAYCADKVGKGMGVSWHPVVVTPEGATHASPFWGAAMWPKSKHVIQRVGSLEGPEDAPIAGLGVVLAVLVFWPAMFSIVLVMCGLPLLILPIIWMMEKDKGFPQLEG